VTASPHPSAPPAGAAPAQLPSLTPLRGIAALWVVLFHFGWQGYPNIHSDAVTAALGKGYLAVGFFFLLSGFVLTHVYQRQFADGVAPGSYGAFLKARLARLYPLHVAILVVFVVLAVGFWLSGHPERPIPLSGPRSVVAFFANLAMVQGLDAADWSWNYPTWSISLEFLAYLGLPVVLAVVLRARDRVKAAAALVLGSVLVALAETHAGMLDQWAGPFAILRCVPEFLLGVIVYDFWHRHLRPHGDLGAPFVMVTAITLGALQVGAPDLVFIPLFALLIPLSVSAEGRLSGWLNAAPLVWLGEVSYALYLAHGLVEYVARRVLRMLGFGDPHTYSFALSLTLIVALTAISLLAAGVSHRLIEVPGRRVLRRRLGVGRKRSAAGDWSPARSGRG